MTSGLIKQLYKPGRDNRGLDNPVLLDSMAPSSWFAFLATFVSQSVHTSIPVLTDLAIPLHHQGGITPLIPTEIAAFKPYTWYASTTACNISDIATWTCGKRCDANPTFKPIATGGDGDMTQYCKPLGTFVIPFAHRRSSGNSIQGLPGTIRPLTRLS